MSNINVVSHVGRDIIQSAQLFRTPEAAVWEYVVNSLQYVDQGTVPQVRVTVDVPAKKITIEDNGSGMDLDGLQHFFTMHGENKERRDRCSRPRQVRHRQVGRVRHRLQSQGLDDEERQATNRRG